MDQALDTARTGPLWLKDPRVAEYVVREILSWERKLQQYDLRAFVVMPNHVHLLILPKETLSRVLNGLKGATARKANLILQRTGKRFWQDESLDHWVRNEAKYQRILSYIEANPVAAGLALRAEDWPWSSANPKWRSL